MTRRIAIVGVGGLGSPAAIALAHAGAGALSLFDPDTVDLSNLPRQPSFATEDVGAPKVIAAAERIRKLHPRLHVDAHIARIDAATAHEALAGHDAIVDGSDDLATKVLLNEVALRLGTPLVHAGAIGLEGQLTSILPGETACLRCLFPDLSLDDDAPTCQESGIFAPVVGAIGFAAAREAAAMARGQRPPLAGRLAILSGRDLRWRTIALRRRPACRTCGTVDGSAAERSTDGGMSRRRPGRA